MSASVMAACRLRGWAIAVIANSAVAAGVVKSFMLEVVQGQRSMSIGSLRINYAMLWGIGRLGVSMGEWAGLNTLLSCCTACF